MTFHGQEYSNQVHCLNQICQLVVVIVINLKKKKMRCHACGRFVPETEKMYSKSTLLGIKHLVYNPKLEPFVCIDCKPALEQEIKKQSKFLLGLILTSFCTTAIFLFVFFYVLKL
jgi:hypothetical protein